MMFKSGHKTLWRTSFGAGVVPALILNPVTRCGILWIPSSHTEVEVVIVVPWSVHKMTYHLNSIIRFNSHKWTLIPCTHLFILFLKSHWSPQLGKWVFLRQACRKMPKTPVDTKTQFRPSKKGEGWKSRVAKEICQ